MLTTRGFWTSTIALILLSAAAPTGQDNLAVLALAYFAWLAAAWTLFLVRFEWTIRRLEVDRWINGRPAGQAALWRGRRVAIRVEIRAATNIGRFAWMRASDRVPQLGRAEGTWISEGPCSADHPLAIEYEFRPSCFGRLRFDGVRLEIVSAEGFFRREWFLRSPIDSIVLPTVEDGALGTAVVKRFHALPGQGIHRYRRAGSGSELLDLRDYTPGDPPKTIAWKVSARRNRLITKQFESEVPVRCTLLLDASDSVRIGPRGRRPVDHFIAVAASLTHGLLANRDPVGLVLCGEDASHVEPARPGGRQLSKVLGVLARSAADELGPSDCPIAPLLAPLRQLSQDVYPDLLMPSINPAAPWFSRILSGWPLVLTAFSALSAAAGVFAAAMAARESVTWPSLAVFVYIVVLAIFWRLLAGRNQLGRFSPARRKPLATLLAVHSGGGPAEISMLCRDDVAFAREAQKLLLEHQVSFSRPLLSREGEYLFRSSGKIEQFRRHLLRAVAHGKDNELFVLLIDLLEHADHWELLLNAVKVALARHHQVMIVCPTPEEAVAAEEWSLGAGRPPHAPLEDLDRARFQRYLRRLHSEFGRLGVGVVCAEPNASVRQVLLRIERVRLARAAVGPGRK